MICPDIWKLEPPNVLVTSKINQLTEEYHTKLKKKISLHYFNKLISVVIPDANIVPDNIKNVFADSDHYILHNVPLNELIQRQFIEGFVNRGSLYGLTDNTRIDVDDCVAITPCKHLYLSLNKEIFQSLGLEGNVSFHSRKRQDRYKNRKRFIQKYFEYNVSCFLYDPLCEEICIEIPKMIERIGKYLKPGSSMTEFPSQINVAVSKANSLSYDQKHLIYSTSNEELFDIFFTVIKIDLHHHDLRNGTKYYERVKNALSHELLSNKSLRICWTPPESSICSSSIAKYFSDRKCDVRLVVTQVKLHREYSLNMPVIGENNFSRKVDDLYATPHELVEYVGMLSLSCSLERDDYLNSYTCVGESINVSSVKVIQWSGMFDCTSIIQLLDELKKYVSSQPMIPWVSLYCHGFPHAALSLGMREHSFGSNGDNSFIVMLTPNMNCLWYEFFSSNKAAK